MRIFANCDYFVDNIRAPECSRFWQSNAKFKLALMLFVFKWFHNDAAYSIYKTIGCVVVGRLLINGFLVLGGKNTKCT